VGSFFSLSHLSNFFYDRPFYLNREMRL